METFASVQDVIDLFRALSPEEADRANALLASVSARLRQEAFRRGRDLDMMISADGSGNLAEVARSVTVDIVARSLNAPTSGELAPLSQFSQSALGYTVSGTFASAGGGIFIKKSELAALGITGARYGTLNMIEGYGDDIS